MNKLIKVLLSINLVKNSIGDDIGGIGGIGNSVDTHDCLISAGYTWCQDSSNCIREWETPCKDNYVDCIDCLQRQQIGENIACPAECDITYIKQHPVDPVDPLPPHPVNPFSPNPSNIICSEVMCMMYCQNGNKIDDNGCQLCECLENTEITQPLCDNIYVCPKVTELYTDNADYTTYRISLVIQPNMNIKNIYAIYGNTHSELMYIPGAYQLNNIFGGNIGGINKNLIAINHDSKYDSWLTIGVIDGDPNNLVSTIGIDFSGWTEINGLTIDNGAVFLIDPNHNIITNECIIGQLTIKNNINKEMLINVQGKYLNEDTPPWEEKKIVFRLNQPEAVIMNTIPLTCNLWNDGCNTCVVNNGIINTCSRLMCFIETTPYCMRYSTNISGH